jgi:hypothetical protein
MNSPFSRIKRQIRNLFWRQVQDQVSLQVFNQVWDQFHLQFERQVRNFQ